MPIEYAYNQTIRGTQSTANGGSANYNTGLANGDAWQYSGEMSRHVVFENNDADTNYNSDNPNETVDPEQRVGGANEQSTQIDGEQRSVIIDYIFEVSDGTNTYEIGVVDVDLNNDGDVGPEGDVGDVGEDGYYLIFIGDPPPPDTVLTVTNPVSWNEAFKFHKGLLCSH